MLIKTAMDVRMDIHHRYLYLLMYRIIGHTVINCKNAHLSVARGFTYSTYCIGSTNVSYIHTDLGRHYLGTYLSTHILHQPDNLKSPPDAGPRTNVLTQKGNMYLPPRVKRGSPHVVSPCQSRRNGEEGWFDTISKKRKATST